MNRKRVQRLMRAIKGHGSVAGRRRAPKSPLRKARITSGPTRCGQRSSPTCPWPVDIRLPGGHHGLAQAQWWPGGCWDRLLHLGAGGGPDVGSRVSIPTREASSPGVTQGLRESGEDQQREGEVLRNIFVEGSLAPVKYEGCRRLTMTCTKPCN